MKTNYLKFLSAIVISGSMLLSGSANAQWAAMGAGCASGSVTSLQGFNGDVYIGGGYFTPYQNLSVWNGTTYSAPSVSPGSNSVPAMAAFDSVLYLGVGDFIYQQIGTSVSKIGTMNWSASAMYFWNHKLYVGGNFDTINGHRYNYIACYNGSKWDSLVSNGANGMTSDVYAFCAYNGQLAVGGYFWTGGTTLLDCVGLWDGAGNWTKLGNGMYDPSGGYAVYALASYNGNLIAGGYLDSASGVKVTGIAQWNGSSWDSIGHQISNSVYALTTFNGGVVAGGYFDSIMFWSGSAWSPMGGALAKYSEVEALTVYNNILYAAGQLTTIGSLSVQNVAQYTLPLSVLDVTNEAGVSVYPNPSTGVFNFNMGNADHKPTIEVYNILGERVYFQQFMVPTSQFSIDLSNRPSGVYIYCMTAEDGSHLSSGRVVVK